MMFSIMAHNKHKKTKKKEKPPIWVILVWIALWQFFSVLVDSQILLASPLSVFKELVLLLQEIPFYIAVFHSILRISLGFVLAVSTGIIFAVISHKFKVFKQFIHPFILIAKSVPVASIIILILIWISSENISIFISFIMVMPVVYTNVLNGILNLNIQLEEMSTLFKMKKMAQVKYIIIPQIMPFFESACIVGLGMGFKAGIAAEVIGLPDNSIGENLYQAKVFLDTPSLFAWTIVILLVSFIFEKSFILLIKHVCKQLGKVRLK